MSPAQPSRYENSSAPPPKRFSKIGVDACGVIYHTGKELHPEAKRLATLCFYKTQPDVAEFYERWTADADFPTDRLFGWTSGIFDEALAEDSETVVSVSKFRNQAVQDAEDRCSSMKAAI